MSFASRAFTGGGSSSSSNHHHYHVASSSSPHHPPSSNNNPHPDSDSSDTDDDLTPRVHASKTFAEDVFYSVFHSGNHNHRNSLSSFT